MNGVQTALDEFRGTPYIQMDLRVTRPFKFGDRWEIRPFAEFFNIFNRNNPGANYVANVASFPNFRRPVRPTRRHHLTSCARLPPAPSTIPVTSLQQLRFRQAALGDFFGPGTTVGIPFAAQLGVRVNF